MQELNNSFADASSRISILTDTNPLTGFAWGSFLEQSMPRSGAVGSLWVCAQGDHLTKCFRGELNLPGFGWLGGFLFLFTTIGRYWFLKIFFLPSCMISKCCWLYICCRGTKKEKKNSEWQTQSNFSDGAVKTIGKLRGTITELTPAGYQRKHSYQYIVW